MKFFNVTESSQGEKIDHQVPNGAPGYESSSATLVAKGVEMVHQFLNYREIQWSGRFPWPTIFTFERFEQIDDARMTGGIW